MKLIYKDEELTLNYTTKNYTQLKKKLDSSNLRRTMLGAANGGDFDVLAEAIKQFTDNSKIKTVDDAYSVIDNAEDKIGLFFEFVSKLGENGFFAKATVEQLKAEAAAPSIDMNKIIERVVPDATKEMMKNIMTTGANTSPTLGASVLSMA